MFLIWVFFSAFTGPVLYLMNSEIQHMLQGRTPMGETLPAEKLLPATSVEPPSEAGLDLLVTWLVVYFALNQGGAAFLEPLELTHHTRGAVQRGHEVMWGAVAASAVWFAGGIRERVFASRWFLGLVCAFTAAYCVMFEMVRGLHITLTAHLADTLEGVLLAGSTFVVVGAILLHSYLLAVQQNRRNNFTATIAVVLIVHAFAFAVATNVDPTVKVHMHHQWWGFVMVFLCAQTKTPSRGCAVAQAMSLGIHLHGLTAFGAQPIFKIV